MTKLQGWPDRFQITIHTRSGGQVRRTAVTLLGHEKALTMAVRAHHRTPDADEIYDVQVERLGPAPRDATGELTLLPDELIDRFEF